MGGFFGSGLSGGGFDATALGGIPTGDPAINLAGSSSWLDKIGGIATSVGSSISGVLNSINYGNALQVQQQQAVPLAQAQNSFFLILLVAVGAFLFFRKKG